jgi:hypothetical protein
MKHTLCFSFASAATLAVFATLIAQPLQAADRQIVIEPKSKTLKSVPEAATPGASDVATGEVEQVPPKRVQPRIFEVEEQNTAGVNEGNTRPKNPKPPKTLEFSVDEETGQVADTPADTEDETAPPARKRPDRPKLKAPKIVKQAPTAAELDAEQDIADDQPQASEQLSADVETDEQAAEPPKVVRIKRRKTYVVYEDADAQGDYGYQPQGYDLPSCHNKSYGY